MKSQNHEAGIGSVVVIGILAVMLIGGGALFLSNSEMEHKNTEEKEMKQADSEDMAKNMNDDSRETPQSDVSGETMMVGDIRLEELSPEEFAADGPQGDNSLEGYLLVDEDTEIDETFLPPAQAGEFVTYSGDLSYAETGDIVLFFHADWCPSCRSLESDINANISAIPDGLSIQKINYDTATELKKQYGVVRQHTLIQVDESGNKITAFTGLTNTLEQVVSQVR